MGLYVHLTLTFGRLTYKSQYHSHAFLRELGQRIRTFIRHFCSHRVVNHMNVTIQRLCDLLTSKLVCELFALWAISMSVFGC